MSLSSIIPTPAIAVAPEHAAWLQKAQDVADLLAETVIERDRLNAEPHEQISHLRAEGFLDLAIPTAFGGKGLPWSVALQVTRIIGRADASIAQILGYHYAWVRIIGAFETPEGDRVLHQTVEKQWLWASPGSSRAGLPSLSPSVDRADGAAWELRGESGFATGAPLADRLFAQVVHSETNRLFIVAVDPSRDEVRFTGEWDVLGQRQSASRSVTIEPLGLQDADILARYGPLGEQTPNQSLGVLNFQLLSAHFTWRSRRARFSRPPSTRGSTRDRPTTPRWSADETSPSFSTSTDVSSPGSLLSQRWLIAPSTRSPGCTEQPTRGWMRSVVPRSPRRSRVPRWSRPRWHSTSPRESSSSREHDPPRHPSVLIGTGETSAPCPCTIPLPTSSTNSVDTSLTGSSPPPPDTGRAGTRGTA